MRLPSHTNDPHDLVQSMSVNTDGPEEIMDAEDYLQPQNSAGSPQHMANGSAHKVTTAMATVA